MISVRMGLRLAGCAQGRYTVSAKGFIVAILYWGDEKGPLEGWGPFAYVPIDPSGQGEFRFCGMRGIPPGASYVFARCMRADFSGFEEALFPIPERLRAEPMTGCIARFSAMSDLHLSSKPYRVRRALSRGGGDALLLAGDMTNDGEAAQFSSFYDAIAECAPKNLPVIPVTGNHDVLKCNDPDIDGTASYYAFEQRMIDRNSRLGVTVSKGPEAFGRVNIAGIDIFCLNCVTGGRRFSMADEVFSHLEDELAKSDAAWRIVLCHAPLLAHNPLRNQGQPYINRNAVLQRIIDLNERVIFISGHTHSSPNKPRGNAEYDPAGKRAYIDLGSVTLTEISSSEELMSPDWNDGCATDIALYRDGIEIDTRSINTGLHFPRGYYRFIQQDG